MHGSRLRASRRVSLGPGLRSAPTRTYDSAVHPQNEADPTVPAAAATARSATTPRDARVPRRTPTPRASSRVLRGRPVVAAIAAVAALVGAVLLPTTATAASTDGHLVGQVTLAGDGTPPNATIDVVDGSGYVVASVDQAARGTFDATVPAGTYWLSLRDPSVEQRSVAQSWYPDAPTQREATKVVVGAGQTVRLGAFTATSPGTVAGTWKYPAGTSHPVVSGVVTAWRLDEHGGRPVLVSGTDTDQQSDGSWTITGLVAGRYVLRFSAADGSWATSYWAGSRWATGPAAATPLTVRPGQSATGMVIDLQEPVRDVTRIDGGNRYDVSAAVARRIPGTGGTVYVANGENFPDALTAGPVAAHDHAPLLLVTPSAIPDVVRRAIVARAPARIVVVGGPPSVSADVFTQLGSLAPDVRRVSGADRYAVARQLATDTWGTSGAERMYLANGTGFADALSAGAAAAYDDVPLMITAGGWTADPAAAAVRRSLGVESVWAVGGAISLSDAVAHDVAGDKWSGRYEGATRFDVSANLSWDVFAPFGGYSDTVYVAVGTKFPDALSGTPLAAVTGSPLVIVQPGCIPEDTLDFIDSFGANHVVLLGGPASLDGNVAALRSCG